MTPANTPTPAPSAAHALIERATCRLRQTGLLTDARLADRLDALASTIPAAEPVKRKPLDLSNLLRHAFLSGRGVPENGKASEADLRAWCEYDPEALPWYQRIRSALVASPQPARPAALDDAQIKHMVQRFLMWKLPETFNPDCGISFDQTYRSDHGPVGTNLLDGVQATAMVRHMLEGLPASPQPARETEAARDVLAERRRQIEVEGWKPEHDDAHDKGEMLTAAWCYMQRHADKDMFGDSYDINKLPPPARWPWDWLWWKPKDRRRDLVKAGALILAEIERLDRAALRAGEQP